MRGRVEVAARDRHDPAPGCACSGPAEERGFDPADQTWRRASFRQVPLKFFCDAFEPREIDAKAVFQRRHVRDDVTHFSMASVKALVNIGIEIAPDDAARDHDQHCEQR